ncbi:hypothetical protein SCP_0705600 [Sparassis crispa]|uniref:Uncharacterized protein n=1 Tax=Sparassis crispa TaxID=139825 RepID=A0A401GT61_9APHY|nr:hypothetical protein SCP_0705600 [Sparassis crispa]GBE85373.1 hypothetical protein SCP_0705600 [Sparassis crispa]
MVVYVLRTSSNAEADPGPSPAVTYAGMYAVLAAPPLLPTAPSCTRACVRRPSIFGIDELERGDRVRKRIRLEDPSPYICMHTRDPTKCKYIHVAVSPSHHTHTRTRAQCHRHDITG